MFKVTSSFPEMCQELNVFPKLVAFDVELKYDLDAQWRSLKKKKKKWCNQSRNCIYLKNEGLSEKNRKIFENNQENK